MKNQKQYWHWAIILWWAYSVLSLAIMVLIFTVVIFMPPRSNTSRSSHETTSLIGAIFVVAGLLPGLSFTVFQGIKNLGGSN